MGWWSRWAWGGHVRRLWLYLRSFRSKVVVQQGLLFVARAALRYSSVLIQPIYRVPLHISFEDGFFEMFAAISPCTLRLCLFEPVVESIWHLLLYSHFRRQIFVADAMSNSVFLFSFRNPPTIGRTEALQENSSPMARRSRWRQWRPRRQKRQWSWSRGLQQRNFGWVSGKPNGIEVWCKKTSIKSYSCPTNVYIYNYVWLYKLVDDWI